MNTYVVELARVSRIPGKRRPETSTKTMFVTAGSAGNAMRYANMVAMQRDSDYYGFFVTDARAVPDSHPMASTAYVVEA